MDDPQPTYRFKWINVDLKSYCNSASARADRLRADAKILLARADEIDEFRRMLADDLVEVEPQDEDATP
jgi:hypothetical protein